MTIPISSLENDTACQLLVISLLTFLLTGCSSDERNNLSTSPVKLSEAKFEVDLDQKIIISHDAKLSDHDDSLFEICVTDLPILHITTDGNEIADDPKVAATLKILQPEREANFFTIGIEWRGRTSQTFPKKSYGFKIREGKDSERNVK